MREIRVAQIASLSGGALPSGGEDVVVNSVSTDTRTVREGAVFVALEGERFDGHGFLEDAVANGAVAVMVAKEPDGGFPEAAAVIRVGDTLEGLQRLANGYRRLMKPTGVGVTGSSGKTSTKDMISAVLGVKFKVRATKGNLNNHIGLPLTLLSHEDGESIGVWEMGMNSPGEIAALAAIAEPEIGVVTNVGTAHLERMGTQEAIAKEKGSLVESLDADGCAILNANDEWSEGIAQRCAASVVMAGIDAGEIRATSVEGTGVGSRFDLEHDGERVAVELPLPGRHMVQNAVLAAAVGIRLGLTLKEIAIGLAGVELTGGRLQVKKIGDVAVLDDTYNANPDSMRAAVAALMEFPCEGRRIAVLGKMAELGESAEEAHVSLGAVVAESGVDEILVVGEEARGILAGAEQAGGAGSYLGDAEAAGEYLKRESRGGDVVLVKGSRSAAMERVIEEFGRL